jgi:hypothetical protein
VYRHRAPGGSDGQVRTLTAGLSERAKDWIEEEARRTGRSREAIVETLAEEAARTRLFPGIAFRGPRDNRRAWLPGSGYDVWEAIEAYKGIGKVRLLEERDFPERLLDLALAYYEAYPAEIDAAIAANDLSGEDLERLYPDLFKRR